MARRIGAAVLIVVVLGACASPSPTPTPTPEPTPTPRPTPTVEPTPSAAPTLGVSEAAQAYVDAVSGYELVPLPAALEEQMAGEMSASLAADPLVSDALLGYTVTSVTQGDLSVGLILVFELEAGYAALPGFEEGAAAGLAESSGGEAAPVSVAGQTAYLIVTPDLTMVFYLDGDFMVMVMGTDTNALVALAGALILANA